MPGPDRGDSANDQELMGRVQAAEDVAAFGSLYDRHATRAYRIAWSVCGDAHRAEEAVQDGFLSIWRSRKRYRAERGSFQAWSMTLIRHAAIDTLRRERAARRPRLVDQKTDAPDLAAPSPQDRVVAGDRADALRMALTQLPAAQAEVIQLAFFGELTHSEIADQLALPMGTVKGRMRLGLERLRGKIREPA